MKSLVLCAALAGMAALLSPLAGNVAHAQDECAHCRGRGGLHGAGCPHGLHGHVLHGNGLHGYAQHGWPSTTHLHQDAYGYRQSPYPRAYGLHGPYGEVGANWGNCVYRYYGEHDLFYNYWIGGYCGANTAPLYLSPRPVPAHVGHTYITYQPLMPHEFMYKHHRTYHRYYDNGMGLTRTCVRYR
ncbi:MAG TPA: hypothetical protein VMP01_26105 [Pirellulaceae bacterium]|nr:hypothetical protein [Pirellulaceae bacterium]